MIRSCTNSVKNKIVLVSAVALTSMLLGSNGLFMSGEQSVTAAFPRNCLASEATSVNSLNVKTASYLTQNGASEGTAIDLGRDCAILIAGRLEGAMSVPQIRIDLPGAASGNGSLMRLNGTGTQVLSVAYIGNRIDDMEVNPNTGRIAVVGSFGVALLNAKADQLLWHQPVDQGSTTAKRVAIGRDGTVAVLSGRNVSTFNASGQALKTWTVSSNSGWYFNDVAIHSSSQSVYVTGFYNTYLPSSEPVQVAYLMSYDYLGTQKWKNWAWSGSALTGNEADTRGYRLAIGRDGYLYFQGEAAGGNNIFRWNPRNLAAKAPNVEFDQYNTTYNTKSNHITYYTRLNPVDGTLVKGQYALSRKDDTAGNTIKHGNITADEQGNVYVVGITAYSIAQRSAQTISGQAVGKYAGGEGYLLLVSPDFTQRKLWTTWTAGNGSVTQNYQFWGVVAGRGVAATAGTTLANGPLITQSAFQPTPIPTISSTTPAGFFSVWAGQP
jgi:hypothetical protein